MIDGAALAQQFAPARIDRDDVWALIPRITAHHDPDYDALGAMGRGQTRLEVRFTDGTTLESSQFAARSVLEPLANDDIAAKYRHLTDGLIDPARQARIAEMVLALDELPGLETLIDALRAPVGSPFGP